MLSSVLPLQQTSISFYSFQGTSTSTFFLQLREVVEIKSFIFFHQKRYSTRKKKNAIFFLEFQKEISRQKMKCWCWNLNTSYNQEPRDKNKSKFNHSYQIFFLVHILEPDFH